MTQFHTQEKTFAVRFDFAAYSALQDWRFDDAYEHLMRFGTDRETLEIVQALTVLVGNAKPKIMDSATFIMIDTAVKYLLRGKEA